MPASPAWAPVTGHNILTGYVGGAGHYAIDDQNTPQGTEPDVLAEDNNFGPYTASDPASIGAVINDHHNIPRSPPSFICRR